MLKGGLNELQGPTQLAPELIEQLENDYKKLLKNKKSDIDQKFEHYYELIQEQLKDKFNKHRYTGVNEFLSKLEHQQLFKIIYNILIKDAISRRTFISKKYCIRACFRVYVPFCIT